MTSRIISILLSLCLLLQVGSQLLTLGWFVLDNQSFTEAYCQNWKADAPLCFGSCVIADTFAAAESPKELFAPIDLEAEIPQYCQTNFSARTLDAKVVVEQGKKGRLAYLAPCYSRNYVGSVFWPPAA